MNLLDYFPENGWRQVADLKQLDFISGYLTAQGPETWAPYPKHIFRALHLTPPQATKVVIIGQDPYQRPGLACGLSFSVNDGLPITKLPPSLKNIYKEAGITQPATGDLSSWAAQGVLLLNSALTVSLGEAGSHLEQWEPFTDALIEKFQASVSWRVTFMLWGNYARSKKRLINTQRHTVLEAAHPSRYSAHNGFFGCDHFKLKPQINWKSVARPEDELDSDLR